MLLSGETHVRFEDFKPVVTETNLIPAIRFDGELFIDPLIPQEVAAH